MRTGGTFNTTTTTANTTKDSFSAPANMQRSPWHSPVPYLFGGLAAMLGLIAFALLILACSYWKLSGHLDNGEGGERDLENGDDKAGGDAGKVHRPVYEEKIVVIMAGDEKPTFLATPMSSRASSFGANNGKSENKEREKGEKGEKEKEEMGNHEETTTTTITPPHTQETQENPEQNQ
ncbi:hypothetical protein L1049_018352 [Liquidambar formosana]|uniref:Uncharacterized protein n=1 Tax=Liquidambar formosana TaxID=63359 RepID=A0AAP0RA73_LIQFO